MSSPSNFQFLAEHSPLLADLGATAERLFPFDPPSCVVKLRLLAESITQDIAARIGVNLTQPSQAELLRAVDMRLGMDAQVRQLFHLLRRTGNLAVHEVTHGIGYREGLESLKVAREIAVWFHRSFGRNPGFKPGPFLMPDTQPEACPLQQQIEQLHTQLQAAQSTQAEQAEVARLLEAQATQEREMSQRAKEEGAIYQELAEDASQRLAQLKVQFEARLEEERSKARTEPLAQLAKRANEAARKVQIDEADTRQLIDLQLIEAGWDADTTQPHLRGGSRPEHGKNKAIAEWPTKGRQAADYVLFAGLTPLAAVEAKRQNINVPGQNPAGRAIRSQLRAGSRRHSRVARRRTPEPLADGQGRPLRASVRLLEQWPAVGEAARRDSAAHGFATCVRSSNTARALPSFHSPQGLLDQLTRSREEAERRLKEEGVAYLHLRDYQLKAIAAVEAALAKVSRTAYWQWPPARAKTRTIIGLMYRLLKTERFRRILFLVDRTALGDAGAGSLQRSPTRTEPAALEDLQRRRTGRHGRRSRNPRAGRHRAGHGRRVFGSDTPAAGGRLRLHHRRRGPPRLYTRPGDDRRRAGRA